MVQLLTVYQLAIHLTHFHVAVELLDSGVHLLPDYSRFTSWRPEICRLGMPRPVKGAGCLGLPCKEAHQLSSAAEDLVLLEISN